MKLSAKITLLLYGIFILWCVFDSTCSKADDFIQLDELSIDYRDYALVNDKARNLLIYPESPKEGINLNINTTFVSYVYWNSTIESLTTSSQYRGIGLQSSLGIRLNNYIDVGMWHHSQHVLDRVSGDMPNFAEEDAIQLKVYLYRKDKGKDSIF
jgi:hypothetical protein